MGPRLDCLVLYDPVATDCVSNSGRSYCLINSVAFHPRDNLVCATFTGKCLLNLYRIEESGRARLVQKLYGEETRLTVPQHAVFTPDGERLVVVNWVGETFTLYPRQADGHYAHRPVTVQGFPPSMAGYKPHGMEISASGRLVAVAYGAADSQPKALATFRYERSTDQLTLVGLVPAGNLPGIPKGICFSPDDSHLLVTFSDAGRLGVFALDASSGAIDPVAKQTVGGAGTTLNRPEDIKPTRDGRHVIVSNSGSNNVAFFAFDAAANRFVGSTPVETMHDRPSVLDFPHGLAVSPRGEFLVVSQFGPLETTADEDIVFGADTPVRQAKLSIYRSHGGRPAWRRRRAWPWAPLLWYVRDRLERRS